MKDVLIFLTKQAVENSLYSQEFNVEKFLVILRGEIVYRVLLRAVFYNILFCLFEIMFSGVFRKAFIFFLVFSVIVGL